MTRILGARPNEQRSKMSAFLLQMIEKLLSDFCQPNISLDEHIVIKNSDHSTEMDESHERQKMSRWIQDHLDPNDTNAENQANWFFLSSIIT